MAHKTRSGMMIFDNSPRKLSEKIKSVLAEYEKKHGQKSRKVEVHVSAVEDDGCESLGVEIVKRTSIIPNHIWVLE